ncbi:hypothetical protein DFH07DRAFT_950013 [Mycena maculata]|uniref:Uncharacterized protein n=1 Tax=Mycena maculata TaxID=230809 RepID=A0AAD7K8Z9_9AGAR|nr:hypothetical protein DFH07DRAFT_950013 [Mycena maculata]
MSFSAPSTPPPHPLSDIFGAMDEESPIAPALTMAQKRTHSAIDQTASDTKEDTGGVSPLVLQTGQNIISTVQRYTEKKRLRVEQANEITLLINDPPTFHHAKILANIFHLSNQVGAIVTAQPGFEPSPALLKNLYNFGAAIMLSSKIVAYKGSDIVKKHQFNLPPGIKHNPANFAKVVAAVQETFTQLRSKIKKEASFLFIIWCNTDHFLAQLLAGLKVNKTDKEIAPSSQHHQNIFKLTQVLVEGTQCTVTIKLCTCVALMRKVFLQESRPKFWDKLDSSLAEIRTQAGGEAKKITRVFHHPLTQDQAKHGVKGDYEIKDTSVDNFQQEVNDLINAGVADLASLVAPQPQAEDN